MRNIFLLLSFFPSALTFGQSLGNEIYINNDENIQAVNVTVANANINDINQNFQIQQQATQQVVNSGNVININNPQIQYNQQKYVSSTNYSSGRSSYSGSSGKSAVKKNKKTWRVTFKKLMKVFEPKYKAPRHYCHKNRMRKCHKF